MEKLRISDNGRYFVTQDGRPFSWLADTAWTVPARLKWDDVSCYMQTRKSQGFTVLQMVALDPEFNPEMLDPDGNPALIDGNADKPNERYFAYFDSVLDMAERYGFYVLLLPFWGQLVTGDDWSGRTWPVTITEKSAYGFARWLGERCRHRKNILWCLGGDRQPIHKGRDFRPVWRRAAEGLAAGVLGRDLRSDEDTEMWRELLITYHACYERETGECSTFSYWDEKEAWISFVMLQSGHGSEVKNYNLVQREYKARVMPVWDGEPAYEMMPTEWPVRDNSSFHGAYMVRKRAYWSLLSGAFGFTYGHASIWNCISEKERNQVSKVTWFEAMHSEGAAQMKILRDFMEAVHPQTYQPCQNLFVDEGTDDLHSHVQAAVSPGGERVLVYFPVGGERTLRMKEFISEKSLPERLHAFWFDPKTGEVVRGDDLEASENGDLKIGWSPAKEGDDQLLILTRRDENIQIPNRIYGEISRETGTQKVFDWG